MVTSSMSRGFGSYGGMRFGGTWPGCIPINVSGGYIPKPGDIIEVHPGGAGLLGAIIGGLLGGPVGALGGAVVGGMLSPAPYLAKCGPNMEVLPIDVSKFTTGSTK